MFNLRLYLPCFLAVLFAVVPRDSDAEIITLYDSAAASLPTQQGWLGFATFGGTGSQTLAGGGVRLQSDLAAGTGYSNHRFFSTPTSPALVNASFPLLDSSRGFQLSFALRIAAEEHTSQDRAGFSVILLDDGGRGIEIGFWEDRVFAQNDNPLFTLGESQLLTTTDPRNYTLRILGDQYQLSADGDTLLDGQIRDYAAFGNVHYTLTNYLFLGDDTSSASIDAQLGSIVLNTDLSAVPEPSAVVCLVALVGICTVRRFSRADARAKAIA
jgi:hypothetical protein